MKQTDIFILLGFLVWLLLLFLIRLHRSFKKKKFLKSASRSSVRAWGCLEEEGYRFSQGKKTQNPRLWIDKRECKPSMQVDLMVYQGIKKYAVVVNQSQSRPDRVAMQKELILLKYLFATDGILIVTLDTSKIQRMMIKVPGVYGSLMFSKILVVLMLVVLFVLVGVFY